MIITPSPEPRYDLGVHTVEELRELRRLTAKTEGGAGGNG
jgi:hypothetical protein